MACTAIAWPSAVHLTVMGGAHAGITLATAALIADEALARIKKQEELVSIPSMQLSNAQQLGGLYKVWPLPGACQARQLRRTISARVIRLDRDNKGQFLSCDWSSP